MSDRSRLDLVAIFAPAVAAMPNPVIRAAYMAALTIASGASLLVVAGAVHWAVPRLDPAACEVLDIFIDHRVTRP